MTVTLDDMEDLVRWKAGQWSRGDPEKRSDLEQEGRIAAWQAISKRSDIGRGYVVEAIKNAMKSHLDGRPSFGSPGHQGRKDAFDAAETFTAIAAPGPDGEAPEFDMEDPARLDQAPLSAHRREILEAIASLPDGRDRIIVYHVFWLGYTMTEAGQLVGGMAGGTVSARWRLYIRPHLQEKLQHLRGT